MHVKLLDFAPWPIEVSRAKVIGMNSGVKLFVELQEAGYTESTYTLIYNPQTSIMFGLYYEAIMG